jgi:hypothetical protein
MPMLFAERPEVAAVESYDVCHRKKLAKLT